MKSLFFLRGRTALYYGLKYLNFNEGDEILVPSLICDVVIDEVKKLGIKPVFYEVNERFEAKWNDIDKKYTKKIKGILMVHFFGKPQKLKKFKIFCKRKKIYLIEDNCHGFSGIKNTKFFGDIVIMSPYKIIKQINYGGILIIKKNLMKTDLSLNSKKVHKNTIYTYFKTKTKSSKIFNKIYRNFFNRPNYESISIQKKEPSYYNKLLDKKTIQIIKDFSFNREKNLRLKRFNIWKKVIQKFKLVPYFNYSNKDNYILWYLVVKINNYKIRKKIYNWGWKNNIDIVSWPSFPNEFKEKDQIYKFSRKFVLFPLNVDLRNDVKKFKY